MKDRFTDIKTFAIWWNNSFILDYWYRQKYNIPFNSKQHRKTEPFDIIMEWNEGQIATIIRNQEVMKKAKKQYEQTGRWLEDKTQELSEDFYDSLGDDFFEQFDDK